MTCDKCEDTGLLPEMPLTFCTCEIAARLIGEGEKALEVVAAIGKLNELLWKIDKETETIQ